MIEIEIVNLENIPLSSSPNRLESLDLHDLMPCHIDSNDNLLVEVVNPFFKLKFVIRGISRREIGNRLAQGAPRTPILLGLCTLVLDEHQELRLKDLYGCNPGDGWLPVVENFELSEKIGMGDRFKVNVRMEFDIEEIENFDEIIANW